MRIIAGSAGGLRLAVPKAEVRPTMDRVKAAIFSSLGARVIDAHVLDLFAGSGALGLEALSRGAASSLFVEQNRVAAATIEKNLATTGLSARVRQQDVFEFLKHACGTFDVIFADPPYDAAPDGQSYTTKLLTNNALPALLNPSGVFVVEKRPEEQLGEFPRWEIVRARRYGATEVLFAEPRPAAA